MAGPGHRTLYKPEPPGRARELCAAAPPIPEVTDDLAAARSMLPASACAMPAIARERILWLKQQNQRRKCRKWRKSPILRK